MSLSAASTKPQFATGPQKCVVMGPVGLLMKARTAFILSQCVGRPGFGER